MSRLLDGADVAAAECLVPLPDGGAFLAGTRGTDFLEDAWWARVDAAGLIVMQREAQGPGRDIIEDCEASPLGGWLLAGRTTSTPGGDADGWLVRLSDTGDVAWQRIAGLDEDDEMSGLVVLADGSTITVGTHRRMGAAGRERLGWISHWDDAGAMTWARTWTSAARSTSGLRDVAATAGGDIVAVGSAGLSASAVPWILQCDASGNLTASRSLAASGAYAGVVTALADGGFLVAGEQDTAAGRTWLTRFSAAAAISWQSALDVSTRTRVRGGAEGADGTLALAGEVQHAVSLNEDAWLALLEPAGTVRDIRRFGSWNVDVFAAMGALPGGDWLMAGRTLFQDVDGTGHAWLLRTDPAGGDDGCVELGPAMFQPSAWSAGIDVTDHVTEDPGLRAGPASPVVGPGSLIDLAHCPSCRLVEWQPVSGGRTCLGGSVTLDASGVELMYCPGSTEYAWTDPGGASAGTGPVIVATPGISGDYEVSLTCPGDPACSGRRTAGVVVDGEPQMGAFAATDLLECNSGIEVSWTAALFRGPSGAGTYSLHRSLAGCADALALPPIAAGLSTLAYFDSGAPTGVPVFYALVAEGLEPTSCGEAGPLRGGAVARACATPVTDAFTTDPPAGAGAVLRVSRAGAELVVTWPGLRLLSPGEHVHVLRTDDPPGGTTILAGPEGVTGMSTRLPQGPAAVSWLDVRIANGCETASAD